MPVDGSAKADQSASSSIDGLQCPGAVDELRKILTTTDEAILIHGGGTKTAFGNAGGPFGSRISTGRLDQVLHYEPADLTIAVEAGMTVAALNRILGEHNQMLPIDCPDPESSTVGGMFASGLGGPRRSKYGSLRDWVLGAEVMSAEGVLTKSGGMVVKNVTGYDLPRLHHGAHGMYGIVTRLNMKVLPREEAARSLLMTFAGPADAFNAGIAILTSQLEPLSITVSNANGWRLSIGCAAPESSIDQLTSTIVEAVESVAPPDDVLIEDGDLGATRDYLDAVDLTSERAAARLSVPASRQLPMLERFPGLSGSTVCADPGSGLLYVSGLPSLEWREAMRQISEATVFLSLPDNLKSGIDVFGNTDRVTHRLLKNLKSEFDPAGRLNRGRYILGI